MLHIVRDIAATSVDDGLQFDSGSAIAETIRDEDEYAGVRVTLAVTLASARLRMHVDVNIGDPIWPAPRRIDLPRLLGGSITVTGYPLPMVYAEKIVTALQRGTSNTRWRDFADLHLLTGRHEADRLDVQGALTEVAAHRRAELSSLAAVLDGYAELAQQRWAAWRRKQRLDHRLPESFADLLDAVISFSDPALVSVAAPQRWDPRSRQWI